MIGGDFRLGFDGYTTSSIAYDVTASELGMVLTDLPSIDSVDVSEEQYTACPACVFRVVQKAFDRNHALAT